MQLENNYINLGTDFYQNQTPQSKKNPYLIIKNDNLSQDLKIDLPDDEFIQIFSGNQIIDNSNPIACVYAGHQFGGFNPRLGDGRAVLLGDINYKDAKCGRQRLEIGLKGSGKTKFSRNGDGLLAIGPAMREYLVSEFMATINIPTTRSLSVIASDDLVIREKPLTSAVLTRVAKSFVRVGTFEYFLSIGQYDNIKKLADYMLDNYFIKEKRKENYNDEDYLQLFKNICQNQAILVASWMGVGFIHGVLNTDNCSIVGETIDYGPCAFMDDFYQRKVFSSIDVNARYNFDNQAKITQWNLSSLANCFMAIMIDKNQAYKVFNQILNEFIGNFKQEYYQIMQQKLCVKDNIIIDNLIQLLDRYHFDYTIFLRDLSTLDIKEIKTKYALQNDFKNWLDNWHNNIINIDYKTIMQQHNLFIIPRNHQIEKVIFAAQNGNYEPFYDLNKALKTPFIENNLTTKFYPAPKKPEIVQHTFCGT